MKRFVALAALTAFLAAPAMQAEGRPAAKPRPGAAIPTRQRAMDGFNARMGRLDTLMGAPARVSRSAEAGR